MTASAAQGLLAHDVSGAGEPVLLLNGGLMTIAAWEPFAGPLAAERRVVRCDLRGQLLSPGTPHPRLEGHADDLLALADALGLDAVDVVGTSFGALVGATLAARAPGRVRSLVLATAAERITDEVWRDARELIAACEAAAAGGAREPVFDRLVPGTFSPGYLRAQGALFEERRRRIALLPPRWFAALALLLRSLEGLDLRPRLAAIRCPTLVIGAEDDRTFPPERARALHAAIPGARLVMIPGSGHALVVEQPGRLLQAVREFLGELTRKGAQP